MPKVARPTAVIQDFPGLITSTDPRDLPPGGAAEQVNLCVIYQGEMKTRLGIKEVIFEEDD